MATGVQTSAGSTLAIATGASKVPTTYDAAGFAALTYTTVGEVTDIGEFGKEYNLVTFSPVGDRKQRKFKGSYNNGSIQVQMGRASGDAGQTAMRTALADDASYAVKVTLQDTSKIYFTGKVMSFKTSVGSVDQITSATSTFEIDSEIVEVNAP
jgi:hypothetical protein